LVSDCGSTSLIASFGQRCAPDLSISRRVYSREWQPFMYWLGISFWLFILAIFVFVEVVAVTHLLRRI
jgi:hypothetical protein